MKTPPKNEEGVTGARVVILLPRNFPMNEQRSLVEISGFVYAYHYIVHSNMVKCSSHHQRAKKAVRKLF